MTTETTILEALVRLLTEKPNEWRVESQGDPLSVYHAGLDVEVSEVTRAGEEPLKLIVVRAPEVAQIQVAGDQKVAFAVSAALDRWRPATRNEALASLAERLSAQLNGDAAI